MRATVERATRSRVTFSEGRSDVIVPVMDDGIRRVRLARVRTSLGLYQGEPHLLEDCHFLDGTTTRTTVRLGRPDRERMDMGVVATVPVRSRDVTDFGKLLQCASTLNVMAMEFGPDNPPSDEQKEAMLRSYQGILEWRRKARERFAAAEGQIDLTEAMMRRMLSL